MYDTHVGWGLTQGANLGLAPCPGLQIENALAENNALHPLLPSLRQSGALRQFFPQAQNCIARTGYNLLSSRQIKKVRFYHKRGFGIR